MPLLRSWFRCFLRLGYKDLAPTEPFSIRQPPDQAKILSPRRAFSFPLRAIPNNQTPFRPFARSPIRRFAVSPFRKICAQTVNRSHVACYSGT
jgi:hypothetical protein